MNVKKWEVFSKLSNKQKCLLMWIWLRDNECGVKSFFFIEEFNMSYDQYFDNSPEDDCYACFEVDLKENTSCDSCPIKWGAEDISTCCDEDSPFISWCGDPTKENAQKVIDVIQNTWIE